MFVIFNFVRRSLLARNPPPLSHAPTLPKVPDCPESSIPWVSAQFRCLEVTGLGFSPSYGFFNGLVTDGFEDRLAASLLASICFRVLRFFARRFLVGLRDFTGDFCFCFEERDFIVLGGGQLRTSGRRLQPEGVLLLYDCFPHSRIAFCFPSSGDKTRSSLRVHLKAVYSMFDLAIRTCEISR